jgi:hypothetical protein
VLEGGAVSQREAGDLRGEWVADVLEGLLTQRSAGSSGGGAELIEQLRQLRRVGLLREGAVDGVGISNA